MNRVVTWISNLRANSQQKVYSFAYFLLSTVIFVNLIQFTSINNRSGSNYKALYVRESDDFLKLGASSSSVRGRWLPYIFISDILPNATVYIPEGSYFDRPEHVDDKLHSYSDVSKIIRTKLSSSEILEGVNPENSIAISIEDVPDKYPYYVFAVKEGNPNKLIPSPFSGVSMVNNLPTRTGVSVALVEWEGVGENFHPTEEYGQPEFYGLFIETSLLSKEVQSKLTGQ